MTNLASNAPLFFSIYEVFPAVLLCGCVVRDLQYLPKFRSIIEPSAFVFRASQSKNGLTAETKALGTAILRNVCKYLPNCTA